MEVKYMPFVSVVIAVHNDLEFLPQAIESMLAQTFHDYELIVIDDASEAAVGILLRRYAASDSRVKLLRNDNQMGLAVSLNRGIAEASGKFIARQDADDISLPSRLQRQIDYLETNPDVDVVGTGTYCMSVDGRYCFDIPLAVSSQDQAVECLLAGRMLFSHGSVVFKKSFINEVGGYNADFVYGQDRELWLRAAHAGRLFGFVPDCLYGYRCRPVMSTRKRVAQLYLKRKCTQAYLNNDYPVKCDPAELQALMDAHGKEVKNALARYYEWLAIMIIKRRKWSLGAWRYLVKAYQQHDTWSRHFFRAPLFIAAFYPFRINRRLVSEKSVGAPPLMVSDQCECAETPPAPKLRILHITTVYPSKDNPMSGVFIKTQLESLARFGIVCDVFPMSVAASRQLRTWLKIRGMLRDRTYDLIHCHYGYSLTGVALLPQFPIVVSYLGTDLIGGGSGIKMRTKRHILVAISNIMGLYTSCCVVKSDPMREKLWFASMRDRCHVIPNGVDLNAFYPVDRREARAVLGLSEDRAYVLFAGSYDRPVKRIELIEEAVAIVRQNDDNVDLLKISGVSQDRLNLYYSAADCLVLASDHEGSPNVVKEALACNLPVVAVDVGDVWQHISGVAGCAKVEQNAQSIANGISDVLKCGDKLNSRGTMESLRAERIAERIRAVYLGVLNQRR
jgi:teichuronic acid biosynthesis glycosyltransferase TuaC